MSKKISKKNEQSLFNNRRFYPGGAAVWTALKTEDIERVVDSVFREGFPGVTQAGQILPDIPLRKFLFLKIPVEMGYRQAQKILVDAWGQIKREPGRADWKRYQGILDRLDADIAAWETRPEDYSYKAVVNSVRDHLNQIRPLVEATTEQARQESRQRWGSATGRAKLSRAISKWIKKEVKQLRPKNRNIEEALGQAAENIKGARISGRIMHRLSTGQARRYYYAK